jgi:hypothetical protein
VGASWNNDRGCSNRVIAAGYAARISEGRDIMCLVEFLLAAQDRDNGVSNAGIGSKERVLDVY